MTPFQINRDQLVRIIAAVMADELARRFGRYIETLAQSSWHAETKVGRGGAGATPEQQAACLARMASLFDANGLDHSPNPSDTFGDWADVVSRLIHQELTGFRFLPATQAGDADTRHPSAHIWQDAAAVASLLQGRRRAISLVAPHSLMGLVAGVLAPNLHGIDVIDGRALGPDELADQLAFGDVVIATPTLWRYLSETLPGMANNVMGLTFGERFGVDLAGRLRKRGLGAVRELYGSTETGLIGWRDSPPDPFVLFDHWRRDAETLVRQRPDAQTARIAPMDSLDWQDDRRFVLGGRLDGAVQIGAVNVFPKSISAIISEHPGVLNCKVRVSQRPGTLDRLIADIELAPGKAPDQTMAWSIDEWCRERLRPPERPRIYSFHPVGDHPAAG